LSASVSDSGQAKTRKSTRKSTPHEAGTRRNSKKRKYSGKRWTVVWNKQKKRGDISIGETFRFVVRAGRKCVVIGQDI
jgi:hypothetical protein